MTHNPKRPNRALRAIIAHNTKEEERQQIRALVNQTLKIGSVYRARINLPIWDSPYSNYRNRIATNPLAWITPNSTFLLVDYHKSSKGIVNVRVLAETGTGWIPLYKVKTLADITTKIIEVTPNDPSSLVPLQLIDEADA